MASSGGSAGAVSADVSAVVSQYSGQAALDLPPLKAKPAPGKHLVYLADTAAPLTATIGQDVTAGAKELGWSVTTETYAGDPASLATAMAQAVSEKPDAILLSGEDQSHFTKALQAADAAGIPVFVGGVPNTPTTLAEGGPAGVSLGNNFLTTEGKIAADYIIKASGGKANIAIVTVPDQKTLTVENAGFTKELAAQCPACTVTTINAQLQQIGNGLPQQVVSELQANPSVNYVFYPYGDLSIGVPAALQTAGIKVNSVASTASAGTYADLKAGRMVANLATSTEVQAWLEVDLVARYFDTGKPALDDIVPIQILTDADDSSATLPVSPSDYAAQFKKLWQVG
ncbi:sugar ABC transporter substrate-binding protein [Nocardia sp. alder85J]|uniref:sugar ABC transporter substrate-binding protein n=1 Tax=Nocardia sp. alder85J TaxID=2862949 RepID=UPI001CD6DBC9|nr:substrate-binding domain-containing protein [Nocardia sp. alder85J]MCX4091017.1 substrate-binding domain-containing protein [Nocardia sp. alder85J]